MKKAVIKNGVVENVILVDPNDIPEWAQGYPECPDDTSRGDTYADGVFTKAPHTAAGSAEAGLPPLAPWQFHAMLEVQGLTDPVAQAIEAIADRREKAAAKAKMSHAREFVRDDPLVVQLSQAVGVTPAELDQMWSEARDL